MVILGNRLKELRLENNLTQKQIATRLGVAICAISSYESGQRYPTYDSLKTLARIFHVSTDYLLGLENRNTIDVSDLNENEIKLVDEYITLIRKTKKL